MKLKSYTRISKRVFSYFTFSDIILTLIILAIAIFLFFNNIKSDDQIVRVNYHNELFGEYSLNEERIIIISEDIQVEIAKHKVRMLKNNCPNQLCVEQGWSSVFPIICVPNQVEIIIDNKKSDEIRQILK